MRGRKMHAKLIIIRGNSGSGKSTAAKLLQKKFGRNTMVISHDVVRRDMLWVRDGAGTKALPLLINLLQYGRRNSEIVILEGILDAGVYRELFEIAKKEFSSNIYAYYYDLPFEETLLRHQTKPNCHEFGEEDMRRWWKEKDFIGIIPEKLLTRELSLDDAVELIWRDVTQSQCALESQTDVSGLNPELLSKLDKLHTTELGEARIRKNMSLDTADIVGWCREKIRTPDAVISKRGKNWYVRTDDCEITVNARSYTIITAHVIT